MPFVRYYSSCSAETVSPSCGASLQSFLHEGNQLLPVCQREPLSVQALHPLAAIDLVINGALEPRSVRCCPTLCTRSTPTGISTMRTAMHG
jgi:hypothetical protein